MTSPPNKSAKSAKNPAKPAPPRGPAIRDGEGTHAGHMDPGHAARLLRIARETDPRDVDVAFVAEAHSRDETAQQFGEEAVSAMTSGESTREEDRDEHAEEEDGGPFVETSASEEFAEGTDESNIPEATREPFPRTSGGR